MWSQGTFTTHEIPLTGAWHVRKRSEGRVVGESEELMKEGDIVILRDCLRGARRTSAACRPWHGCLLLRRIFF